MSISRDDPSAKEGVLYFLVSVLAKQRKTDKQINRHRETEADSDRKVNRETETDRDRKVNRETETETER